MSHCATLHAAPSPTAKVKNPHDYDHVYRKYRSFLYGVVYHSGVPIWRVEDASGEIFVRMMAQDGLSRFDRSFDHTAKLKAYLASYFSLGARAELSRIRDQHNRQQLMDDIDLARISQGRRQDGEAHTRTPLDDLPAPSDEGDLLDNLLALTEGDARHFIEVAAEYPTYTKARAALEAEGWDTLRIRRAVKRARSIVRAHLCIA